VRVSDALGKKRRESLLLGLGQYGLAAACLGMLLGGMFLVGEGMERGDSEAVDIGTKFIFTSGALFVTQDPVVHRRVRTQKQVEAIERHIDSQFPPDTSTGA